MALDRIADLDAVVVPIGGGGLIAGVALAVKTLNPAVQVIGVEPERCASWTAALRHGRPVPFEMDAEAANQSEVILGQVDRCFEERGLMPNVVAVDFYAAGDLFEVVDQLNGLSR